MLARCSHRLGYWILSSPFCIITQTQRSAWVICNSFKLKLIWHRGQKTDRTLHRQIKDERSVIVWSAAHCFLSFQRQHPSRCRALPTRCPGKDPEPVLKDASHAQTSLDSTRGTPLLIYLSGGQFALHHVNECQLFLCFTIRSFIFGVGSIKKQNTLWLCELADGFYFDCL